MNFPLPARSAYLALRRANNPAFGTHLKASRCSRQWATTRSSTEAALSRAAETWIFQPWGGRRSPSGLYASQSPRRERVQPSGTAPRSGA